MNSNDRNM